MTTALLWFRRDLRLADHPALTRAVRDFDRVVPVFVLDDALRNGRFASAPREAFMLGCLRALDADLRERGSGLVVRDGPPEHEIPALAGDVNADAVLWTSDVSPYARARDRRVTEALRANSIEPLPQGGGYVVDVSKPRTQGGTPFTMFTPFHKRWRTLERRTIHRAPAQLAPLPSALRKGSIPADPAPRHADRTALPARRGRRARRAHGLAGRADRPLRRDARRRRRGARHERPVALPALGLPVGRRVRGARRAPRRRGRRGLDPPALLARLLRPRPARPSRQRPP